MNFDQFASLIRAGYNEAQITEINRIMGTAAHAAEPVSPSPDPSPVPAPDPMPVNNVPAPATEPEVKPAEKQESETQQMLREMLGLMRKGNINQVQTPGQPEETAEQIIAKVLNP